MLKIHHAKARLKELSASLQLPNGYSVEDPLFEAAQVGKLKIHLVGLCAQGSEGASSIGSAACLDGFPVDRAYFELVERLSIQAAQSTARFAIRDRNGRLIEHKRRSSIFPRNPLPQKVRRSLSNGIALHDSWPKACAAALNELIERDRVLRSFRGQLPVSPLPALDRAVERGLEGLYRMEEYRFGPDDARLKHVVSGTFFFPLNPKHPLAYGFGTGSDSRSAQTASTREALQRLGFLWGERIPKAMPRSNPSPLFHQEFYLYPRNHALLRTWLTGAGAGRGIKPELPFDGQGDVDYSDLTPESLKGLVAVSQARTRKAAILYFGASDKSRHRHPPHPIA